jgi:uncharacterized coiled-coil protein SlyX
MKLTSYLYIFALAVLCSPGFFLKHKSTQNILYSLIFTMLLYITFDFVNKYTENYEQYNVDVKGVDSLVDLIKTQSGGNDSKKIDINNQLFQEAGANDANCWNALGKNQKELEIIKVQLDSYAGSKESIDKLNNQLETQKQEIDKLQEELKGFEGTEAKIDQINIQIKNYQTEIDKLKQQLALYNQTEQTIGEINNQISKIQTTITDLNTKISECNTLNSVKEQNIATLTGNIKEQGTTITTLETRKTNLTNDISSQNDTISLLNTKKNNLSKDLPSHESTINSLRSRINSREGCGSPVHVLGGWSMAPWYMNWRNGNFGNHGAQWIWWTANANRSASSTGKHYIYYYNNIYNDSHVYIYATADNAFRLYVNDRYITENGNWTDTSNFNVDLQSGRNKFDFYAWNYGDNNPAGLLVVAIRPNGQTAFKTDSSWVYM